MYDSLKKCYNCETPLPAEATYCLKCGQKYTTGRIKLRNLIGDFVAEQFNLDSRIFNTIKAIFIPGKLTEEFFLGKHKTYSSPLRLFLITAVLFASVLAVQLFKDKDIGLNNLNDMIHENERSKVLVALDSVSWQQKANFNNKKDINRALDSVAVHLREALGNPTDSIDLDDEISLGGVKLPTISRDDFENMTAKQLSEAYGEDMGFWGKLFFTQGVKAVKQGGNMIQFLFGKMTLALFFMMPFLAIFLKIIYIRSKKFYVEHLIFSFHFHAFVFLVFTIIILLIPFFDPGILGFGFLIGLVYLFLSLKRIYQQDWFNTLLKIFIISIIYLFLLIIFVSFTATIGFLLF